MTSRRTEPPGIFAGYVHDVRGPFGSVLSVCCEGPACAVCAKDLAAKRLDTLIQKPVMDD
jgi:hypothetical protein